MRTHLFALLLLISYTLVYPQTKNQKSLKPEMIKVEGGTFQMGSNDDFDWGAKPVHKVTVGSFMIGKYEVTQELWESVMGSNPSYFKGSKKPVEQVSWYDVVEFCNKLSEKAGLKKVYAINKNKKDPNNSNEYDELKWLVSCDFNSNGYRLPTEAEWEYAARGGNKSKGYEYSGSNDIEAVAWYESNSGSTTHEAGRKSPNELGIYDMSGNVWEWCWDLFSGSYYTSSSQTNPRGPTAGSNRVLRGGSWYNLEGCRVARREHGDPGRRYNDGDPDDWSDRCGFRVVRTR